ncbi:uncharacterized protein LY79DRAFT_536974 [Colletotrichum navitas]|uniref:Uncharacterized protein n=1 Tax=Colletotrichum navitas TaxID=681940 RepID=A0AAD8VBI4_9PEZI|nr:uncharacterized protein LY79DRAFT_536974 [Colletotrichum navitas]KAK1599103.1 hypothetical protein LY79DRAFT_536974 [Colletotrichum navitas]
MLRLTAHLGELVRTSSRTRYLLADPRAVWGFGLLAIVDMAMNAGAGAAAAKVGSELNGVAASTRAIQLGALTGLTKAALTAFREIVLMNGANMVFRVLLFLITSSFGICPLLMTEVGNILLEETPKELVVAAVVAAVPLFFEAVRDIKPKPDGDGGVDYFRWVNAIFLVATDALGGYVFARMAANQGIPISNYHAACSAGAVYGTLTFLSRAMTGCVALFRFHTTDGKVSDIFGVWEAVLPDKIIVTEEEYLQMQRGLASTLERCFRAGPRMLSSLFNCCCCCCCFFNNRGRKMVKEMREDIFGDDNMLEQAQDGGKVMARGLLIAMTGNPQHRADSLLR